MSLAKSAIQKAITEYSTAVRDRFPDSHLFIFGSAARGERRSDSDIDLLVISKEFNRFPGMERLIMLSRLRRGYARKMPLDIIGVTPREFQFARQSKNIYWQSVTAECIPLPAFGTGDSVKERKQLWRGKGLYKIMKEL